MVLLYIIGENHVRNEEARCRWKTEFLNMIERVSERAKANNWSEEQIKRCFNAEKAKIEEPGICIYCDYIRPLIEKKKTITQSPSRH